MIRHGFKLPPVYAIPAILTMIGLPPVMAQLPEPCDQNLIQQISVKGLNSSFPNYPTSTPTIPTLGFATPDMSSVIDPLVANYMNQNGAPGGVVAITYNNHLIFAKSYGYADIANNLFTQPDSKLRIASVTKAMTAMGILKLVHDTNVLALPTGSAGWQLNYQPFASSGFGTPIGGTRQAWIQPATVTDLLYHEGGWAEDYENDTNLQAVESTLSTSAPPDCATLLRYVEAQPKTSADFLPGMGESYSNIGFCALGETIRRLSGASSYIDYMQSNVFSPLGMNDTQLGSTQKSGQLDREVSYYPCGYFTGTTVPVTSTLCGYGSAPVEGPSLWAPHNTVSAAYGGGVHTFSLNASEGAGGLVSTAVDLAHFAGAIASGQLPNLANSATYPGWPKQYYAYSTQETPYDLSHVTGAYKGMGWDWVIGNVFAPPAMPFLPYDNFNLEKDGALPGTASGIATTADGYSFAAIFNGENGMEPAPYDQIFWGTGGALFAAYAHAKSQPWDFDFFSEFAQPYSSWMSPADFATYLSGQAKAGLYPSRLEGRTVLATTGAFYEYPEYRARFAPLPPAAGTATPNYMYGQSCSTVVAAVEAASAATPLVSLQRFQDVSTRSYLYQAVWSAPIP